MYAGLPRTGKTWNCQGIRKWPKKVRENKKTLNFLEKSGNLCVQPLRSKFLGIFLPKYVEFPLTLNGERQLQTGFLLQLSPIWIHSFPLSVLPVHGIRLATLHWTLLVPIRGIFSDLEQRTAIANLILPIPQWELHNNSVWDLFPTCSEIRYSTGLLFGHRGQTSIVPESAWEGDQVLKLNQFW